MSAQIKKTEKSPSSHITIFDIQKNVSMQNVDLLIYP